MPQPDIGPPRKRLRRDIRTCHQCRQRKVKCELAAKDAKVCNECIRTGCVCSLQQADAAPSPDQNAKAEDHDQKARLDRIEILLKKLIDDSEAMKASQAAQNPNYSSESLGSVESEPSLDYFEWEDIQFTQEFVDTNFPSVAIGPLVPVDEREPLLALLPCQQDAEHIINHTTTWLCGMGCGGGPAPKTTIQEPNQQLALLDRETASSSSLVVLAKILIYFALYLQQLPPEFHSQLLQIHDVEETIKTYIKHVKSSVLSQDDLVCSLDGLECLQLLGMLYINDGNIQHAWLTFRRALDVATLLGLSNCYSTTARKESSMEAAFQRRLWLAGIQGDAYCSLLLGLEPTTGPTPFGPDDDDWHDPSADEDENFQRKLFSIAVSVARGNARRDYSHIKESEGALAKLQASMQPAWWGTPRLNKDRDHDQGRQYNRFMCHLWFYQVRISMYMPSAFGCASPNSTRNLDTCLEASRMVLYRYLGLCQSSGHRPRSRSVDLTAFSAAIAILLALVSRQGTPDVPGSSRHESDIALLQQVMETFENLTRTTSSTQITKQSSAILSAFLGLAGGYPPSNPFPTHKPITASPAEKMKTTRQGMENVLVSLVQQALETRTLALHIIDITLENARPDVWINPF